MGWSGEVVVLVGLALLGHFLLLDLQVHALLPVAMRISLLLEGLAGHPAVVSEEGQPRSSSPSVPGPVPPCRRTRRGRRTE